MLTQLADKLQDLERLCKLHGVSRLEVVGSAAREVDFDPTRSDVDFLVEFEPGRLPATPERLLRLAGRARANRRPPRRPLDARGSAQPLREG